MSLLHSGSTTASDSKLYVEDVFSTYLYTGNGSTQTINNRIDLAGKGGMVWIKSRNLAEYNSLTDTARGVIKVLRTDSIGSEITPGYQDVTSFNSEGFSCRPTGYGAISAVFWTFRKAPKFFDVVTYTGNGGYQVINHNLGSVPGCIIIKRTDAAGDWGVWHRSAGASGSDGALLLNTTAARYGAGIAFSVSSTTFSVFNSDFPMLNSINGATYVAYLFAHNAGGFGLTGTDNVISCGSFAGGTNVNVNLGYEPQWLLVKKINAAQNWFLMDTMRGFTASQGDVALSPNLPNAEPTASSNFNITSTGFINAGLGFGTDTYIYIAIRRPMKTPASGTEVFAIDTYGGTAPTPPTFNSGFPVDCAIQTGKSAGYNRFMLSRLTGTGYLSINLTNAENTGATYTWGFQNGWRNDTGTDTNYLSWMFRRAPGFFDVVCYTGTGGGANAYQDVAHNLGVTPELIIVKQRNAVNATAPYDWPVYQKDITTNGVGTAWLVGTAAKTSDYLWRRGASGQKIDASTFSLNGNYLMSNQSGGTYVAYLFASCPGVSKVGSYTGNGSSQTINCGFTTGARFILIKRTDSSGDWYVWDSARGIVAANDPHLSLNSTAVEVTTDDSIDPAVEGFVCNQNTTTNINVSGGTYIFLSIA